MASARAAPAGREGSGIVNLTNGGIGGSGSNDTLSSLQQQQQPPVAEGSSRRRADDDEAGTDSSNGNDNTTNNDEDNKPNVRMELTEHERNLAILIKETVNDTPDLDPISDFMCAQLALICYDDIEDAIERALQIQHFREEYAVLDTLEDGRSCFTKYMEIFPALHLNFTYWEDSYVLIIDNACFDSKEIRTPDRLRTMMALHYYYCHVFCPDFDAIRNGAILVFECEGYDWTKQMMGFKTSAGKIWEEITSVYPVVWKKVKYFNPSTAMHIIVSMIKPFFPEYLRNKIEFCHRGDIDDHQIMRRLDELYLVPTVEASNQRFLKRVEETMKLRFRNERAFEL